ncbi:MAG TPA: putative molybdenum carrier protein [Blastocatellia bacterium]|nr:putative molybdenum carrier protein [Blastocatellia bacterium]
MERDSLDQTHLHRLKIVSGGQTGADRAALDWAIRAGVPHGGWCPRGRIAEDGVIAARYRLREAPSADYAVRTELNVIESDGTVIFSVGAILSGGTLLTAELAEKYQKPLLHLCQASDAGLPAVRLAKFIADHNIRVLNVGGPKASQEPGVYDYVVQTLDLLPGLTPLQS